jgi:hypothetical protein
MKKRDPRFLMAAVAGITMGLTGPASLLAADEKKDEVKCWGINSCGKHAKCSVKDEDIAAFRALLGDKEYKDRFDKTTTHTCGSHASCGAADHILNWTPVSASECKAKNGYLIEETKSGETTKKVAKKA